MRQIQKLRKAQVENVISKFAIPTRRRYLSNDATVISYAEVAQYPALPTGTLIQKPDGTFYTMSGYDW